VERKGLADEEKGARCKMIQEKRFEILLEEMRGRFDGLVDGHKALVDGQKVLADGQRDLKEYIERKFKKQEKKEEERFGIIDVKLEGLKDRVQRIEQRLDRIENKVDRVVTKEDLRMIESRIERLEVAVF